MADNMATHLRDSTLSYGLASRAFHWIMAYLILWQFFVALSWIMLGEGAFVNALEHLGPAHGTVGVLVFALVIPRAIWALSNRANRPPATPTLTGRLASAMHGLFYVLMLVIPALALARAYGSGKGYMAFGLQVIPATGEKLPWLTAPANLLHSPLAWIFCVLIGGHIMMALIHGVILRDGTLRRMAGSILHR